MPHDGSDRRVEFLEDLSLFAVLEGQEPLSEWPDVALETELVNAERESMERILSDYRNGVISRLPDYFPKIISSNAGIAELIPVHKPSHRNTKIQDSLRTNAAGNYIQNNPDQPLKIIPARASEMPKPRDFKQWIGKEIKFLHPKEGEVIGRVLSPTGAKVPKGMMEVEYRTKRNRIRTELVPIPFG